MHRQNTIQLIINADDYAYYPCISQGILAAAKARKITATGILANSPDLNTQLSWLDALPELDVGVHLNLTSGQPLTPALAAKFAKWQGHFPNAYHLSGLILSRQLDIELIRLEWQAQIAACQGKPLVFLNSHEHIHMLPILFPLVLALAAQHNIPYLRLTQADWLLPFNGASLLRNSLIQGMSTLNRLHLHYTTPLFIGLSRSGRLNLAYLEKLFSRLQPGKTYELMCHPGYFKANEISNPKLTTYHDWEQELNLLLSPELAKLYEKYHIHLAPYPERNN